MLLFLAFNRFPASKALSVLVFISLVISGWALVPSSQLLNTSFLFLVLFALFLHRYVQLFFSQKSRLSIKPFAPLLTLTLIFVDKPIWQNLFVYGVVPTLLIYYTILMWAELKKEGKSRGINWFENPGTRLVWLRNFCLFNCLLMAFWFLGSLGHFTWVWMTIGSLCLVYLVYYQLIKESNFLTPIPLGNKYQKSTLSPNQKVAILSKLDELLLTEKFYLSSETSLSGVAELLQTTTHHLSQVINEAKGRTFQELITSYRIKEAKLLLKSAKEANTKIEHIATMVGYNSKSAFNTSFKKLTGLTPKEFKVSKDVLTYRDERLPDRKLTGYSFKTLDLNGFKQNIQKIMVTNFFKVFYRRITRNKIFTFINLFGLTIGFACSILIYLFINAHISYDTQLPESDQIYRISWVNDNPQTRTPHPMAQAMVADFPEVETATSISPWYGSGLSKQMIRVENKKTNKAFLEPDFFFVDSTFLDVFKLEVIAGDADALKKPFNLVITEKMAQKYFGDNDPIGQELSIDDWGIVVAAVIKGMPEKSHFHFTGLVSYVTTKSINPTSNWYTWEDFGHFNYIKTTKETNANDLESRIPKWVIEYLDWSPDDKERLLAGNHGFRLQSIQDIHLHSHLRWELENNGNVLYIYILSGALAFLLLIVCINYINLTTAKSIERAREVGIRKTLGALSQSLTIQYYFESLLFCFIAMLAALFLAGVFLPFYNHLTNLSFSIGDLVAPSFIYQMAMALVAISILSGLYPALSLNNFKPGEVLKGAFTMSTKGKSLRNGLVVFQFFISAILIVATLIILRQLEYMKTKELGFDQDALIALRLYPSVEIGGIDTDNVRLMESKLMDIPGVIGTSAVSNLPGGQFNQAAVFLRDRPEARIDVSELFVDYDTPEVLGLELIEGRTFDRSFAADSSGNNYIINQRTVDLLNLENPIGKTLGWFQAGESGYGTIIGIVKDFHFESLHKEIQPLVISLAVQEANHLIVKLEGSDFQKTLAEIAEIYISIETQSDFEYIFLDDQLEELYNSEVRTLNIFSIFAAIALFLACMGLLGLAIALLNQSVKEIGIRKILGARSFDIFTMILSQFLKLIGISLLLGLPVGYLLMQVWISEFSYQAPFGISPFLFATLTLTVVAIMSVSVVIVKIAHTNPSDTLRYE